MSQPKWKKLLAEAKHLSQDVRTNLFQIVKRAVAVYDDREFRESEGLFDDQSVEDWLDAELFRDVGLTFLELRAVFGAFPQEAAWKKTSLRDLYEQCRQQQAAERVPRERVSWKTRAQELEGQQAEADHDRRRLQKQLEITEFSRDELLKRVEQLTAENTELRGRIRELERIVNRELQVN